MITTTQLARAILADRPEIATLDHYQLSEVVRAWVSDMYLSAFSRVKASTGAQLPINPDDQRQMTDLEPHYTSYGAVAREIETILGGQQTFTQLQPPNTVDPSTMTQQQYKEYREAGNSPFKVSQGLLN